MIMGRRRDGAVRVEEVRPSGSGTETKLVLLTALLTVFLCGGAVVLRTTAATSSAIADWQLDAFKDLRAEELAIFNSLHTAAPEIEMIHEEMGGWPTVDALAAELIPPFVRDAAWEKNGAMTWARKAMPAQGRHIVLYAGHPSGNAGTGLLPAGHAA